MSVLNLRVGLGSAGVKPEHEKIREAFPGILGRRIGHGQSAHVFASKRNRDIVYKIFKDIEAAKTEVMTLKKLAGRPYFIRCYDVQRSKDSSGKVYIALKLERLPNGDLLEQFKGERMRVDQAISIVRQASVALKILKELDIVHNDIKPGNLALVGDELRIFDFGTVTKEGEETNKGTKGYLSPEGHKGRPRTPKNDIWSLATTIFFLYTKQKPSDPQFLSCWQAVIRDTARKNSEPEERTEELISLLAPMLQAIPSRRSIIRRRTGGCFTRNPKIQLLKKTRVEHAPRRRRTFYTTDKKQHCPLRKRIYKRLATSTSLSSS